MRDLYFLPIWHLDLWSILCKMHNFCVRYKVCVEVYIFGYGHSIIPVSFIKNTILSLLDCLCTLPKFVNYIGMGLFLASQFSSIDLCTCSFANITLSLIHNLCAVLKSGCESFDFVLFQYCVGYSWCFAFPYNFRIILMIYTKMLAEIWWGLLWIYRLSWKRIHLRYLVFY